MALKTSWALPLAAGLSFAQACHLFAPDPTAGPEAPVQGAEEGEELEPFVVLRRLSAYEYDNAIEHLLEDDARAGEQLLPADPRSPFDNDATLQEPSQALVEAAELLAHDAAARLLSDDARRARVIGCDDASCFPAFVERFGRRALRRPLHAEELDAFLALEEQHGFDAAVEVAVVAFLQHPRFLYRVEVDDIDGFEIATRLSFLLWGSIPDDPLLDAAGRDELDERAEIRVQAERMLRDPRAQRQLSRLVAMWLGFDAMAQHGLAAAMRVETDALIHRVVFEEKRPWRDLFTATETFVTPDLAAHYGFDAVDQPGWVTDPRGDRAGILSHGTFLSVGAKHGDTSPTLRGLAVRERLLCDTIGAPPPGIEVDDPIPAQDGVVCKEDRYRTVHAGGGCAGCHQRIDPIGFGLERYDAHGRYRTTEPNEPSCTLSGEGEVVELGTFEGPGELGTLLVESDALGECLSRQLVRYALGRSELDVADARLAERLATTAAPLDAALHEVLLELVTQPAFVARAEDPS